jgi:hypothetical protein
MSARVYAMEQLASGLGLRRRLLAVAAAATVG